MRILLLGKSGQVGWELQRSLAPLGDLTALDARSADLCGDLRNLDGLRETVRRVRPHAIVNAAAYTAVDRAETDLEAAFAVNALAPGVLADEAQRIGALLVHYSTDYVFDGSGAAPWSEDDAPAPLNVYGQSKLAGEQQVLSQCERSVVLRTSWVYSARGSNFAKTMLRLASEREQLKVVDDRVGAPTGAELLADVTAHCLVHVQRNPQDTGLYHVCAGGATSWHGYARHVVGVARASGAPLKVGADRIEPVASTAFPTVAARPQNSRLGTDKFRSVFGLALPDWHVGVERMLAEIL